MVRFGVWSPEWAGCTGWRVEWADWQKSEWAVGGLAGVLGGSVACGWVTGQVGAGGQDDGWASWC